MACRNQLLLMGGSAVCFSFGTYWNKGCYTLSLAEAGLDPDVPYMDSTNSTGVWGYLETVEGDLPTLTSQVLPHVTGKNQTPTAIPRFNIKSAVDFDTIVNASKPIVLENLDIGPCTALWTHDYLIEHIGEQRKVHIFP